MTKDQYAELAWVRRWEDLGALWVAEGSPRYHAVLTSGRHSDSYFNAEKVCQWPRALSEAADELVNLLEVRRATMLKLARGVVGPAMGAVTLAHEVARAIEFDLPNSHDPPAVQRIFVEKDPLAGDKAVRLGRCEVDPGRTYLLVEDVITTAGSAGRTAALVESRGGVVLPVVLALLNRSGKGEVDGREIVALVNREMRSWAPEECPYCRDGSEAIRPKDPASNWDLLAGRTPSSSPTTCT